MQKITIRIPTPTRNLVEFFGLRTPYSDPMKGFAWREVTCSPEEALDAIRNSIQEHADTDAEEAIGNDV
jgi:hypothetical protein